MGTASSFEYSLILTFCGIDLDHSKEGGPRGGHRNYIFTTPFKLDVVNNFLICEATAEKSTLVALSSTGC